VLGLLVVIVRHLVKRGLTMFRCFSGVATLLTLFMASFSASADKEDNKIPDALLNMLTKAEKFELLSISPARLKEKPADAFHGWKVLGKTEVKKAEVRKKLLDAFQKGVADNTGTVALCFKPRHGIRVTYDGKTADFVICFECYQVQAFVGDKPEKGFLTTKSPQTAFDEVLEEAKVPLPEKPKE
jgi:hypothetical protein